MSGVRPPLCVIAGLSLLALAHLHADPAAQIPASASVAPAPPPGLFAGSSPLPDPGGWRAKLSDRGITFNVLYAAEVFGNPVGGYRQGVVEDGLLTAGMDVDLGKLTNWQGLKFHVLGYVPDGESGTNNYTRDLNRFSNIDAFDTASLFELWLEQSLFGNVVNLRVGQVAADAEFAATQGGALFLNASFGALPIISLNVPEPIYPQADPGVRLRLNTPDARFYLQVGVYAGNPNADRNGDPAPGFRAGTAYNDHGIRFPISGNQGAFSNYEAGFLLNQGKDDKGLPGAYRIGAFFHTGRFSDRLVDNEGHSLADPLSTGLPRAHQGDEGFYAVAEQVVYRRAEPGGGQHEDVSQTASAPVGNAEDSAASAAGSGIPTGPELRVFGRLGAAPDDRNVADFYLEAGFNYRALLPGRGGDVFGLACSYTDLSGELRQLDRDVRRFQGIDEGLADYEIVLEATYQVNLAPWLSFQPDLQYIVHPGGRPRNDNALVLGLRTVVTF